VAGADPKAGQCFEHHQRRPALEMQHTAYSIDQGRSFFHVETDAFNRQNRTTGVSEIAPSNRTCKFDANDPYVWSGRALQVDFAELAVIGLASMYPAFDWSVWCSGPSWISARVRSR
jgi:hypothetical protein